MMFVWDRLYNLDIFSSLPTINRSNDKHLQSYLLSTMLSQLASKGSSRIHQAITTSSCTTSLIFRAAMSSSSLVVPSWATVDPTKMGTTAEPYAVSNLVDGKWTKAENIMTIPHPVDKDMHPIFTIPDTQVSELGPFLDSLKKVPKSGVHNPLKNPERYVQYGEISRKVSSKLILRVCTLLPQFAVWCSQNLFHYFSYHRLEPPCRHRRFPSTLLNAS